MPQPKACITPQERATLIAAKRIALAITGALKECPQGAHVALLYPPMMAWLSYPQFTALISFLVKSKLVLREGDTLYPMPEALPEAEAAE